MVFNLSDHNSVVSQFLLELRDKSIQQDRARFRRNVARIGHILAYEISKSFHYRNVTVETPVASTTISVPDTHPLLITIMRAGLPFMQGFLEIFDHADAGFIGACRDEESDEGVKIKMDYAATPSINGRQVILADPMLATGKSVVQTLEFILNKEIPQGIHVASVIAAPEGIKYVLDFGKKLPCHLRVWTAAIDQRLNEKFYIIPGLGDAGDLCFGNK
jgi:uracil phosphoribosyltransferase